MFDATNCREVQIQIQQHKIIIYTILYLLCKEINMFKNIHWFAMCTTLFSSLRQHARVNIGTLSIE